MGCWFAAPIPSMNISSGFKLESLIARLRGVRFFSISLVIHIVLVFLCGGIVLFRAAQTTEVFLADQAASFLQDGEMEGAEDLQPQEFAEPASTTDVTQAVSLTASAIVSLKDSLTSFQVTQSLAPQSFGLSVGDVPTGKISASVAVLGGGGNGRGFFGAPIGSGRTGLIGTFYDLKQTPERKPTNMSPEQYGVVVCDFLKSWNKPKLQGYFQAPTLLASSRIFTPDMPADEAPKAFGVAKDVNPSRWLAWYRAQVSPPKTGTYHFVGAGDDVLVVRFEGKTVLDRCWYPNVRSPDFDLKGIYDYGFAKFPGGFAKGPAVKARAGEYYDIDILIGEQPGGRFFAALLIEEEGVEYQKDSRGNPILHIFQVEIEPLGNQQYPPHMDNGPVWKVRPPSLSGS